MFADGARVVIGLKQQPLGRTFQKGLRHIMKAETDVEALVHQQPKTPGVTPITVPYPGLAAVHLPAKHEARVQPANAMQKKGKAPLLTEGYAMAKSPQLHIHGCGAKAVKPALANGNDARRGRNSEIGICGIPGMDAPSVDTVLHHPLIG